jgi:hypothetical protein
VFGTSFAQGKGVSLRFVLTEEASMTQERLERRRTREERVAVEETMVLDPRSRLTPAQMVERKLVSLLADAPLPVSKLRTERSRGPR